jgi:hypothetical protein
VSREPAAAAAGTRTGWLRVATPEAGYAGNVVADVSRITRTACGRALVREIIDSGGGVFIEKPEATDPPNASLRRGAGGGADCVIAYYPRQWPNPLFPTVPSSDVLLFAMLRQALAFLRDPGDVAGDAAGPIAIDSDEVTAYRRERDHGRP